jgi:hypothetical protein
MRRRIEQRPTGGDAQEIAQSVEPTAKDPDDFVREATAAGVDRAAARAALKDPSLSRAFSSRGKRAWDSYQERLGHFALAEEAEGLNAWPSSGSHHPKIQCSTKGRRAIRRIGLSLGIVQQITWPNPKNSNLATVFLLRRTLG